MNEEKKRKKTNKQLPKDKVPSEAVLVKLLQYYESGRLNDAEKMAISITKEYPNHQFGWKVLGAVLKQTGRISESLTATKKTVILTPKDTHAHYNLGNTLMALGRLEEAILSYVEAIALKPDFVEAHSNLGDIFNELGRLEEAAASYTKAITIKSDIAELHYNLGITLQGLGKLVEAEASYRQAITLNTEYFKAHNNLGIVLQELGRFDDAEVNYKQAIALKPDFTEAHYNLGLVFNAKGNYEGAIKQFSKIDFKKSKIFLLNCLYLQNEKSMFLDQLNILIDQGEVDPLIGSLGCRSELNYDIEKPNLFCKEPLKYVLSADLKDKYNFKKIFVNTALSIFNNNMVDYRSTGLLTNGIQTYGNLFEIAPDLTKEIKKIIHLEVDKYRFNFKDSDEGLIKNWPTNYSISSWLINMKSGGELRPHMHEEGWISGSIYINVPPKQKTNSGNLVVCIEDEQFLKKGVKNQESIIEVVTGSLVLFPSSLLHYTIPFESKENRIVLAFDIVPD